LRYCATSRNVAGSIPYGVIGIFSLISFRPHYVSGIDSVSNRNEYQEYFLGGKGSRCVGLITSPPPCADCLEIWEPQPPGTLRVCTVLYKNCVTFTFPILVSFCITMKYLGKSIKYQHTICIIYFINTKDHTVI
jgi:hypothetical protein